MMMDIFYDIWGAPESRLTMLQIALRALVAFIVAVALIRISGRRSFGMRSPFDNTLAILLGAILAKGVIGDVAFSGSVVGCTVLALTHRLFGYLSLRYKKFGNWVKGDKILLYENGTFYRKNMTRALISENDLNERVRMRGYESLDQVKLAYMERSGDISMISKE